ncbi:MAG: glycosyltransferase family 2 protein [Peptococcaceae bacterium]|nr:glycosyltransferase family 2 protein [Peptococcaceae bacterium]
MAIRKQLVYKIEDITDKLRAWGRRYLPYSWKRRIKRIVPMNIPPSQARIPIPKDSVEKALSYWMNNPEIDTAFKKMDKSPSGTPQASIIIATYNNFAYTRMCIESIYRNTGHISFEVIVVDNGSEDDTVAYLKGLADILPNLHVILNPDNKGFACANNQGIMKASGNYIVLLNNDTIVTRDWLSRLIYYLDMDPKIGIVGPVTNSIGNEQMIAAEYSSLEEMDAFAEQRATACKGQFFDIEMLAMFCAIMRRTLVDQVGLLDEQYELGMFEDDDYAYRVRLSGYKLVCVEDVFVHHFGGATMGKLADQAFIEIFERNRRRFEKKWGCRWRPMRLRTKRQYISALIGGK